MQTLRLLSACLLLVLCACAAREEAPPNVVLISLDTVRPDRLSCYGASRETSPAIDSLAKRGVRFTNAFSPSPWTAPAHAAMLTGRYPSSLTADPNDPNLYRAGTLLSTRLREHGYLTAAVTGGGFVSRAYGAARGFQYFATSGDVDDAATWLRPNAERLFFLFFHTYVAHVPYSETRFAEGLAGGRFAGTAGPEIARAHHEMCVGGAKPTPEERDYLLALYDGGIARADEMVGQITALLRSLDVEDRTLVIVTSDHGEEFWEHTGLCARHGHSLYDELLRVPLIWVDPMRGATGHVVEAPVGLVDLVPTILARVGALIPEDAAGEDLGTLIAGGDAARDRVLFAEAPRFGPTRASARGAAGKLIRTLGPGSPYEGGPLPVPIPAETELYLASDSGERANAAVQSPDLARELAAEVEEHWRSRSTREIDAPAADAATREQLRALGYAE